MCRYEFHAYYNDRSEPNVTVRAYDEPIAAKAYAGRLAKRINGPVDLALDGDQFWPDRYITTAMPSEYHTSGYRLERLD